MGYKVFDSVELVTYNRIVVKLKAIEYKKDFFYYLSSYFLDLSF